MPDLPVKCLTCGATGYTPNFIGGDGSATVRLEGNLMVNACPKCGGNMQVVDGVYDISAGVVTAFRALGREQLEHIRDVLDESRSGALDADAVTKQVAAISPDIAALIDAMQRQRRWSTPVIVNTLIAAIAVVLAWMMLHAETTITAADHEALQHDVRTAIEQAAPAGRPQSPAATPPLKVNPTKSKPKRRKRPAKKYGRSKRP